MHNGLWHYVLDGLIDDAHVGVNQVTDGFHLTLQLGVCEVFRRSISLPIHVGDRKDKMEFRAIATYTVQIVPNTAVISC